MKIEVDVLGCPSLTDNPDGRHGPSGRKAQSNKKVVVCGHCLVTVSLTITETLKRLSSLPILMLKSLRW